MQIKYSDLVFENIKNIEDLWPSNINEIIEDIKDNFNAHTILTLESEIEKDSNRILINFHLKSQPTLATISLTLLQKQATEGKLYFAINFYRDPEKIVGINIQRSIGIELQKKDLNADFIQTFFEKNLNYSKALETKNFRISFLKKLMEYFKNSLDKQKTFLVGDKKLIVSNAKSINWLDNYSFRFSFQTQIPSEEINGETTIHVFINTQLEQEADQFKDMLTFDIWLPQGNSIITKLKLNPELQFDFIQRKIFNVLMGNRTDLEYREL